MILKLSLRVMQDQELVAVLSGKGVDREINLITEKALVEWIAILFLGPSLD